jgi:hypothetical protein
VPSILRLLFNKLYEKGSVMDEEAGKKEILQDGNMRVTVRDQVR